MKRCFFYLDRRGFCCAHHLPTEVALYTLRHFTPLKNRYDDHAIIQNKNHTKIFALKIGSGYFPLIIAFPAFSSVHERASNVFLRHVSLGTTVISMACVNILFAEA